jgi:hypothetical protein
MPPLRQEECNMKRNLCVICFGFLTSLAFSIELWNGFTTDMSKEQYLIRAQEVLSPKKIDQGERYYIPSHINPTYDDLGYPDGLTRVAFDSNLQEYDNINAYFYNGKLFFIKITWSVRGVLGVAKEKYGNPQRTLKSAYNNVYYWSLSDKDFYVDDNAFIFVDKVARAPWVTEQRREIAERQAEEDRQRRAREEEQRQRATSTVHF